MIYNLEGTPGSGKTYYFVSKVIAPLLSCRDLFGNMSPSHIYTNIEGLRADIIADFLHLDPTIADKYVHKLSDFPENCECVKNETDAVRFFYAEPDSVHPVYDNDGKIKEYTYKPRQPGSVFVLDELQNYFCSRDFKTPYSYTAINYLSRHRHYHHLIWWATQDDNQVDVTFRRQTEKVYFLERLDDWGRKNCTKKSCYEGYLGHQAGITPLSTETYKLEKKWFSCYKSTVFSGLDEKRVTSNIWLHNKGLRIVAILILVLIVVGIFVGSPITAITGVMGKKAVETQSPPSSKWLATSGGEATKNSLSVTDKLIGDDEQSNQDEFVCYTQSYTSEGVKYYVVDGFPQKYDKNLVYAKCKQSNSTQTNSAQSKNAQSNSTQSKKGLFGL